MSRSRRRRTQVRFTEGARKQVDAFTDATEVRRLDRALAALANNPDLGRPTRFPLIRDYRDETEGVRVIYSVTLLRTAIVVAYVEA
ncbi:type II toxin-antitoxin system RelE/ParE family toxin [Streptacidiphilus monticola]|uniref:Type II toxin-antitoxin system RelE/ParE family toxin n=1 Tax=Streptacidiphilus monticola TaxID=2161674 RepID=A0ABW1GC63_9ACTN